MKEKKISLGADGKPIDHISSSNSFVSIVEDDMDNWTQNFDDNGDCETKEYGDDSGLHDKFRRLKMTKASLDDVEMPETLQNEMVDPAGRDQLSHDTEIPRADLELPDTYQGEDMKGDLKKLPVMVIKLINPNIKNKHNACSHTLCSHTRGICRS
jgi:hypothetical protein